MERTKGPKNIQKVGPMTSQPTTGSSQMPAGWQPHPNLQKLCSYEYLLVKQEVELFEAICGCETNNKYIIISSRGEHFAKAQEHTNCCIRNCCGAIRPFTIEITDLLDQPWLFLDRPYRPCVCNWCCCCHQKIIAESPRGILMGVFQKECSCCKPRFKVLLPDDRQIYSITGPLCPCKCCSDYNFVIKDMNGNKIGNIAKKWGGIIREALTDADTFGVEFPTAAGARERAVLLGGVFLIDFMYFEDNSAKETAQRNDLI